MLLTIAGVAFDAMGTLFDEDAARQIETSAFLERLTALNVSVDEARSLLANTTRHIIARVDDTQDPYGSFRELVCSAYRQAASADQQALLSEDDAVALLFSQRRDPPIFPDVAPCLRWLTARGLPLGVLSDADPDWFAESLHHLSLDRVPVVRVSRPGRRKPCPAGFEDLLARMGLAANQVVYVGDSLRKDVEGALAVGMHAVFLDRKNQRSANLVTSDPDRLIAKIPTLADLPSILQPYLGRT